MINIIHFILGIPSIPENAKQVSPVHDFDLMSYISVKSKLVNYEDCTVYLWVYNKNDFDGYYAEKLQSEYPDRIRMMYLINLPCYLHNSQKLLSMWKLYDCRFYIAYLADYYRMHILEQYGGWYSDTDSITIKPFTPTGEFCIGVEADVKRMDRFYDLGSLHFMYSEPGSIFVKNYIYERSQIENSELNNVELAGKLIDKYPETCRVYPMDYFNMVPISKEYQEIFFTTNKYKIREYNYEVHLYNSACSRNGFKDKYITVEMINSDLDSTFNRIVRPYVKDLLY